MQPRKVNDFVFVKFKIICKCKSHVQIVYQRITNNMEYKYQTNTGDKILSEDI